METIMKLRKLEEKDASLMLEWMHDESVVKDLNRNFGAMTIEDCRGFIDRSQDESVNLHKAIVDDNDEYMGTVSLKDIDKNIMSAEFGITIRKCAMGSNVSRDAMKAMLEYGKTQLGLRVIFWCVDPKNARALRFYDKNGYERVSFSELNVSADYEEDLINYFVWYKAW